MKYCGIYLDAEMPLLLFFLWIPVNLNVCNCIANELRPQESQWKLFI